jgi:hypothetical protein
MLYSRVKCFARARRRRGDKGSGMIGRAPIAVLLILVAQMLSSGPSEADILVRNVDVITMTSEEIARACDVLIRGQRFLAVAPAGTIPAPVHGEVVDGTGKFLMPGLMDMHVHLTGGRAIQPDMLFLYAANGVTTVLSMSGSGMVLDLRRQVEEGGLAGPSIFTTSPIVGNISDGRSSHPKAIVQDHPSPNLAARTAGARADMTMAAFVRMEMKQDPMGRCARTRANRAEGPLRWVLLGRKRPQRGLAAAESVLKTPAALSIIEEDLLVVVTGSAIWEMSAIWKSRVRAYC